MRYTHEINFVCVSPQIINLCNVPSNSHFLLFNSLGGRFYNSDSFGYRNSCSVDFKRAISHSVSI